MVWVWVDSTLVRHNGRTTGPVHQRKDSTQGHGELEQRREPSVRSARNAITLSLPMPTECKGLIRPPRCIARRIVVEKKRANQPIPSSSLLHRPPPPYGSRHRCPSWFAGLLLYLRRRQARLINQSKWASDLQNLDSMILEITGID